MFHSQCLVSGHATCADSSYREIFQFSANLCHSSLYNFFIHTFRFHISIYPWSLEQIAVRFSENVVTEFFILAFLSTVKIYLPKPKSQESTSFFSFLNFPLESTGKDNCCLYQHKTYSIRAVSFVMFNISCKNLETKKRQPLINKLVSSS